MSSSENPCGENRTVRCIPSLLEDFERYLYRRITERILLEVRIPNVENLEILTLNNGQMRDSKGQSVAVVRYGTPEILTFPFLEEQMQYVNRHAPSWANAVLLGEVSARPLHRYDPQYGNGLTREVYELALQYIQSRR